MFNRKRSREEFAEEIEAHIEMEAEELQREGLSEEEARWKARRKFGSVRAAQERFYLHNRWVWLDRILRDLKFGLRSLREGPGFTITAVLTLALGMGANTAVFSVMNAVMMRSLPVADPDRLVYLRTSNSPQGTGTIDSNQTFSYPVYDALRRQSGAMSAVIAYVPLSGSKVGVRIDAEPEEAEGDMVSGTFFSGLGVELARGRGFTEQDEKDHAQIAVISSNYWARRFARKEDVLGSIMHVNGFAFTVVGIAGAGFEGLEPGMSTDFWIPLQDRPGLNAWGNPLDVGKNYVADPTWWCLRLVGRLNDGVTRSQAAAAMQPVFQQAAYIGLGTPKTGEQRPVLSLVEAKGFPGYDAMYRRPLSLLMGMVGLVLLIALTNVAMLLVARNATKQREFSMKLALGAGRGDLLRQMLIESLMLVIGGGLVAWLFAIIAARALGRWAEIESSMAPDGSVLRFTVIVLAAAVILFGLAPLRVALAAGPTLAMKTGSATASNGRTESRMGKAIVAMQMTFCVVLLVAAGLLIRTLKNLENTPLGFNVDGLVVFGVNPEIKSLEQGRSFYRDLTEQLRVLPGVESVTVMEERIGSWGSDNGDMKVDGKLPQVANGGSRTVRWNVAGPNFFTTLGVPVLAGRDFADSDTASTPLVGIVNERVRPALSTEFESIGALFRAREFPSQCDHCGCGQGSQIPQHRRRADADGLV
jgi:predicted permease